MYQNMLGPAEVGKEGVESQGQLCQDHDDVSGLVSVLGQPVPAQVTHLTGSSDRINTDYIHI